MVFPMRSARIHLRNTSVDVRLSTASSMCYITRKLYTVCAHSRVGELVECKTQKVRNEKWQDGGCCEAVQLSLWSCRPAEKTELKYRFCKDCRDYFKNYETSTADAILSYWAFKKARGYFFSISPKLVPTDLVFGRPLPPVEDSARARGELIALGKALPRKPLETPVEWLQRLEKARTLTLELAEKWPHSPDCQQGRDTAQKAVRMQPRLTSPMSIYAYAHLGSIMELDGSHKMADREEPLQAHFETLERLCGRPPLKPNSDSPEQQLTGSRSPGSSPLGQETQQTPQHEAVVVPSTWAAIGVTNREGLSNASLNPGIEDLTEPNVTSHFSVSDIDPEEAAGSAAVSLLSDRFSLHHDITAS